MKQVLDKDRFGPWALVTGASSGIGKELSRQLAANGINVVMAARRIDLLKEVGDGIEREFSVEFRAVQVDLSEEGFIDKIKDATRDLDIGLLVSNACGIGSWGSWGGQRPSLACGIGSWGGQRPSLASYVTGTGPPGRGDRAAGGC